MLNSSGRFSSLVQQPSSITSSQCYFQSTDSVVVLFVIIAIYFILICSTASGKNYSSCRYCLRFFVRHAYDLGTQLAVPPSSIGVTQNLLTLRFHSYNVKEQRNQLFMLDTLIHCKLKQRVKNLWFGWVWKVRFLIYHTNLFCFGRKNSAVCIEQVSTDSIAFYLATWPSVDWMTQRFFLLLLFKSFSNKAVTLVKTTHWHTSLAALILFLGQIPHQRQSY